MSDTLPLQKWLIRLGIGSKREVRHLIRDGLVTVEDRICTRYAEPVTQGSRIRIDGFDIDVPPTPLIWLMNKPKKHITGLVDPKGRPTLAPYLPKGLPRMFHVGRLDFNTEGALIWTNDGALARKILHPDTHLPKVYHVKIRGHLDPEEPRLEAMRKGLDLGDFVTRPCPIRLLELRTRATWIEITLTEGRHRQIRRMCAAVSMQIVKLRRVAIGPVLLGALNPRCARPLSTEETIALRRSVDVLTRGRRIAEEPSEA